MGSDRVRIEARVLGAVLVPFLVAAFVFLTFEQPRSGELFAWQVNPPIMAAFVGAGYLGGAYYFMRVIFGRKWHRLAAGLPPISAFVWFMLIATVLHWSRFDVSHFPFQVWLLIYVLAPVLVPALWWFSRKADDGAAEPGDRTVPDWLRQLIGLLGLSFSLFAAVCLVVPAVVAANWFWTMTPLLARILGGWTALLGVGGMTLYFEPRWSGWRIEIESIALWHALVVWACFRNLGDFTAPVNLFVIGEILGLIGFVALYLFMSSRPAGR